MKIKDRIIRIEKTNRGDRFIVDEYGIKDGEIYHRNIAVNEGVYDAFEKKPDSDMLLNEFLAFNKIESSWKRYELKIPTSEMESSTRLFANIDLDRIQNKGGKLSKQDKDYIYKEIYGKLFEQDTLINNPLIIDIFNEAIKGDPELAKWESVFPFFR